MRKRRVHQDITQVFICVMILAVVITASMIITVFHTDAGAYAETETAEKTGSGSVRVIRVPYSQGQKGIQKALNKARKHASAEQPYQVIVEPGTYRLKRALNIYSNTELISEPGTEYKETKRDNLLKVGMPGTDTQARGFYYQNITINGGKWSRCKLHNSTGIKIAHAKNVTLENAELCNAENSHLVETAGVDGLQVKNCYFHDSTRTVSGNAGYECVQIDILARKHFNGYAALDEERDCVSKNITVENCRFRNVVRTVGSHTAVLGKPFRNVVFQNNTVTDCHDAGFYVRNVRGLRVVGNRIRCRDNGIAVFNMVYTLNGYYLADGCSGSGTSLIMPVNGVIADNNIETFGGNGIYLLGRRLRKPVKADSGQKVPKGDYYVGNIKVENNTIRTRNRRRSPIIIADGRNISIRGNYIIRPTRKNPAIHVTGGSRSIRSSGNKVRRK